MHETAKSFEDLWIWQQARSIVARVYVDFARASVAGTDFGFRDQVQRASVSIMNNIAEGFERSSDADFARFLDMAKASCGEVRSMYYTAEDLAYISAEIANDRRQEMRQLAAGIATLRTHLRK